MMKLRWPAWAAGRQRTLLAFAAVVVVALVIRLLVFDRYIPYLEYSDESNMYTLARHWRGVEDFDEVVDWLRGYSPLYPWLHIAVQHVIEALSPTPWVAVHTYFYWMRLLAGLGGVVTVVLVMTIGWQVAGPLAGWLGGLVWAVAPIPALHDTYAIPDPLVYLASAAALTMIIRAWKRQSPAWTLGSLLAVIAGIYLKYSTVHLLVPWGLVTLALLWRDPRRVWPWVAGEVVFGLLAAYYVLFVHGAVTMQIWEAELLFAPAENKLLTLIKIPRGFVHFGYSLLPVGHAAFFVVGLLGALAYGYSRRRGWRLVDWRLAALLGAHIVAGSLITPIFYPMQDLTRIRYVIPFSISVVTLTMAGAVQVCWTLEAWSRERGVGRLPGRLPGAASAGFLLGLGVVLVLPGAQQVPQAIQRYRLTDTRVYLWAWSDTNVPPEGMILMHPESRVYDAWNRPWRGYDGVTGFNWWLEDPLNETPQGWAERGMAYFAMTNRDSFYQDPASLAFTDQLLLLKTIRGSAETTGPELIAFYRILPPEVATPTVFGGQIALVGYDLGELPVAPGGTLAFRPYWRALTTPTVNYSMFVHLYPAGEDVLLAQHDGPPTNAVRLPQTWDDPEEVLIGADVALAIPDDLPPGEYRLAVGLYDWASGQRLPTQEGAEYLEIAITVGG